MMVWLAESMVHAGQVILVRRGVIQRRELDGPWRVRLCRSLPRFSIRLCTGSVGVAFGVAPGSVPPRLSFYQAFLLLCLTSPPGCDVFDAEGVVGALLDTTSIIEPFSCIHPKLLHDMIWVLPVPYLLFSLVVRECGISFVDDRPC